MSKSARKRIALSLAGLVGIGLLLGLHVGKAGYANASLEPPALVSHEPDLLRRVLNLPPKPITDCRALASWLKERPLALHARVARKDFIVELQYRPPICSACAEAPNAGFSSPAITRRLAELQGGDLFHLRLSPTGSVQMPAIGMGWEPRIAMIAGHDTIPCAFVHAETLPPIARHRSILLGFEAAPSTADRTVLIADADGTMGGDLLMKLPANAPRALNQAITSAP